MTEGHPQSISCKYCYTCTSCSGVGSGGDDDRVERHTSPYFSGGHLELVCSTCDGNGDLCAAPPSYLRELTQVHG